MAGTMTEKDDIKGQLLELPHFIKSATRNLLDITEKSEKQHKTVKELILSFNSSIAANPAFKNELQRKTELENMFKASEDYQTAIKIDDGLNNSVAQARIDLEYIQDIFKAYLAIAGMI